MANFIDPPEVDVIPPEVDTGTDVDGGLTGDEVVKVSQLKVFADSLNQSGVGTDTLATVTVRPGVNLWYEGENGFVKTTTNQELAIKIKQGSILTVTYEPPGLPGSIYCVGDVVPISNIRNESDTFDSISSDLKLTLGRCFLVLGDCQIYWTSEK